MSGLVLALTLISMAILIILAAILGYHRMRRRLAEVRACEREIVEKRRTVVIRNFRALQTVVGVEILYLYAYCTWIAQSGWDLIGESSNILWSCSEAGFQLLAAMFVECAILTLRHGLEIRLDDNRDCRELCLEVRDGTACPKAWNGGKHE